MNDRMTFAALLEELLENLSTIHIDYGPDADLDQAIGETVVAATPIYYSDLAELLAEDVTLGFPEEAGDANVFHTLTSNLTERLYEAAYEWRASHTMDA